jgi:tetratricopeptide (TPR) repeat protein
MGGGKGVEITMTDLPQFPDKSSDGPAHTRAEAVALLEKLLTHTEENEDDEAIQRLGQLIDLSEDLNRTDGVEIALARGKELLSRDLNSESQAILHYFLGNAWEVKRRLTRKEQELLDWEQPELEKQFIHLRHAAQIGRKSEIEPRRLCPMLTNLGNLLNRCGRIIDALRAWDRALELNHPDFGMALGNRGRGLAYYASLIHDPRHQVFHLREAYASLSRALSGEHDGVHSGEVNPKVWTEDLVGYDVQTEGSQWSKDGHSQPSSRHASC